MCPLGGSTLLASYLAASDRAVLTKTGRVFFDVSRMYLAAARTSDVQQYAVDDHQTGTERFTGAHFRVAPDQFENFFRQVARLFIICMFANLHFELSCV
jgi:hypothetical protein